MKATINELEIRSDLKIRKGSIVSLDFDSDGRTIETRVDEIIMSDGDVFIASCTTGYGCPMSHSADQYRRSGTLVKY